MASLIDNGRVIIYDSSLSQDRNLEFYSRATVITFINYNRTVITIVNYNRKTFIVQATGLGDEMDNHSSLIRTIINYGRKKFYNTWPCNGLKI